MAYDVYVTAPELNAIIRTDMHSDRMKIITSELREPQGIAFGPDNSLYVIEGTAGQLTVVDSGGKARKHAGGFSGPKGIAVDNDGNVYVCEGAGDSIKVVDSKGTVRTVVQGCGQPWFVAFDGKQSLYCSGGPNHDLRRYDLQGKGGLFHTLTAAATGVACDGSGNVYVSGEYTDRREPYIARFEPSGAGALFFKDIPNGKLTVLGYTGNGYLIYSPHGLTVGLWKSSDWSFVRHSAWATYAATPRDFDFPPS